MQWANSIHTRRSRQDTVDPSDPLLAAEWDQNPRPRLYAVAKIIRNPVRERTGDWQGKSDFDVQRVNWFRESGHQRERIRSIRGSGVTGLLHLDAETRVVVEAETAVRFQARAVEWVVGEQCGAIQINKVDQRSELDGRGNS